MDSIYPRSVATWHSMTGQWDICVNPVLRLKLTTRAAFNTVLIEKLHPNSSTDLFWCYGRGWPVRLPNIYIICRCVCFTSPVSVCTSCISSLLTLLRDGLWPTFKARLPFKTDPFLQASSFRSHYSTRTCTHTPSFGSVHISDWENMCVVTK